MSAGPIDVCTDKAIGVLAMAGGALVMFAGLAVIAAAVFQHTGAGRAAGQAAAVIPAARIGKAVRSARPSRKAATSSSRAPARVAAAPARSDADRATSARLAAHKRELAAARGTVEGLNSDRSTASIKAANRDRSAARAKQAARRPQLATNREAIPY